MFRIAATLWLFIVVGAFALAGPHEEAEAAHDDDLYLINGTNYRWWGIVGYLKAGIGAATPSDSAAIVDALSSDTALGELNQRWAQVGLFRGTGGYLTGGSCLSPTCVRNTTGLAKIYTENRNYLCTTLNYTIVDHSIPPAYNHAFWSYWVGTTGPGYCGEYYQWYSLAKTYSNGWPEVLRTVPIQEAQNTSSMETAAFLEVHNRGSEQGVGFNCFGASYSATPVETCNASSANGLHLYTGPAWPLWTPSVDPTDGVHHDPAAGCGETENPYTYYNLASWYTFLGSGGGC